MTKSLEALIADVNTAIARDSSVGPNLTRRILSALEQARQELSAANELIAKIKTNSCHVDTAKDAFIPNSLDAWGRPVRQYLPYNFSGEESVSTRQYAHGWNDAGGYWLNYVTYLQGCIRAAGGIVTGGE